MSLEKPQNIDYYKHVSPELYRINGSVPRHTNDLPPKPNKGQVFTQDKRSFNHEIQSRAAAVTTAEAPTTVLTDEQLKQCGYAYINNPIVRRVTNTLVFFTQSGRTRAVVEANDELLEVSNDEESKKLQEEIDNDTLSVGGEELEDGSTIGGQPARIKELKRKIVRLGKRVKFHVNTKKALTSAVVFGRGFLEIVRLPAGGDWPIYGEPIALKHLISRNVLQCFFNERTGVFEGIDYNTGKTLNPVKFIKATNLIPFFYDDNNMLANTQGSGLSAVWPILSVSQSDDVINDEDIPEITKNTGGVLTVIKAATNDDSKLAEIKNKANGKTQMVVGAGLIEDISSYPLGRDPHELTDVRTANSKYITQGMNVPLFTIFEDTANFATANQAMQVYKAGSLKDYRTWLQGVLEDYWFDTILADHFNIDVKDVIALPIKVNAVFEDINFETRAEVINGDKILNDIGVMDEKDIAKDIDRKDLVSKLESQEAEQQKQQEQAVNNAFQQQRNQIQQLQSQNQMQQQMAQATKQQQQQASAAASVKEAEQERDESEINNKRLDMFVSMKKILDNL